MIFPVVDRLASEGFPIAVRCRLLAVSTSGFHDWKRRHRRLEPKQTLS